MIKRTFFDTSGFVSGEISYSYDSGLVITTEKNKYGYTEMTTYFDEQQIAKKSVFKRFQGGVLKDHRVSVFKNSFENKGKTKRTTIKNTFFLPRPDEADHTVSCVYFYMSNGLLRQLNRMNGKGRVITEFYDYRFR
jgi:hypothetical protein